MNEGNGKSNSLRVGEGVATDGEVAAKGDVISCGDLGRRMVVGNGLKDGGH